VVITCVFLRVRGARCVRFRSQHKFVSEWWGLRTFLKGMYGDRVMNSFAEDEGPCWQIENNDWARADVHNEAGGKPGAARIKCMVIMRNGYASVSRVFLCDFS